MKVVVELWAFIAVNHRLQEEGILAAKVEGGGYQPYVFTSQASMMKCQEEAQDLATRKGVTILVKRFASPVVVQTFEPKRH